MRHVPETGSTNADLVAASASGAPHGTVLAADHQTAGRGRLDRTWDAPPGANLLVSFLFRATGRAAGAPADPGEWTRRVGLAAVAAVGERTGRHPRLKWPNDLLLDDRKLAGVLAQTTSDGSVVVGLGLNVGWSPEGAADLAGAVSPPDLLRAILRALDDLPDDVHDSYRAALDTLGRRVRVELPAGELIGRATDVEPDGRLVVLDDCAVTHRVSVGDIVHLRSE